MSRRADDLTGQRFGRLVVTHRGPNISGKAGWICQCDCGKRRHVRAELLKLGNTQSCGCLRRTTAQETMRKRALSRAGDRRYRPVEEVVAEIFKDPLKLLDKAREAAARLIETETEVA